jgi:2-polyprenyl-3-methyl-5-hydroxy-6-metoxy-1,4-benzoquinol methylase
MTGAKANNDCCLICGANSLKPLISIADVPTLCNRLCMSEAEAANALRGTITLSYCHDCGHVVNSAFDQARVNYDERFENTLTFSARYREYAQVTADRVINRYALNGKRIVEIGCGNGDFLRLLCGPGNHGEGYDPSQPTSRWKVGRGSVEILGRNFAAEDARGADFVCCRHVLEHLLQPMDLLRQLRESLDVRDGAVVFFEVPNGLFTLDRLGIWDIIHEHVSYFMPSSLVRAFERAGFTVCATESAFDDQYLWVEARVDGQVSSSDPPRRPAGALYSSFSTRFADKVARWRRRIDDWRNHGKRVVIWGGGAKGVMFLNLLRVSAGAGVDWVVDINPRKQGHFVPLMGQKIVAADCLLQNPPDLLVVMNPEYEGEIRETIENLGIRCEVMSA